MKMRPSNSVRNASNRPVQAVNTRIHPPPGRVVFPTIIGESVVGSISMAIRWPLVFIPSLRQMAPHVCSDPIATSVFLRQQAIIPAVSTWRGQMALSCSWVTRSMSVPVKRRQVTTRPKRTQSRPARRRPLVFGEPSAHVMVLKPLLSDLRLVPVTVQVQI